MSLEDFESPLGPGEAFFNKDALVNFYLKAPQKTEHFTYSIGIQGLFLRDGAKDKQKAADLIETASRELKVFVDQIADFEAAALAELRKQGWPDDIPLEGSQLVFNAGFGRPREFGRPIAEPARLSFYAGGHLDFAISPEGVVAPIFDKPYLDRVLDAYAKEVRIAELPKLQHKVFGEIERGSFVSLKRKKLGRRFVSFDLYLPDDCIDEFTVEMLDPFAELRENMAGVIPRLIEALTPLRVDWVQNWLHPSNVEMAKPFEKAFPKARETGSITSEAFADALWLSSVCISPFGTGSAAKHPVASWDFHVLPRDKDNTIFVVRTDAGGNIIEVCTES